jgi:glucose-6-phosphate isomerase
MPGSRVAGPHTGVWKELEVEAARLSTVATRDLVAAEAQRFDHYCAEGAGLLLDYTRQRVDEPVMTKLAALADAVALKDAIQAMWRGEPINATEGRSVLHVALRQPRGAGVGGTDIEKLVLEEREHMLAFAEGVRSGAIVGSAKQPFRLVVNIGIGGSDLGPAMAVEALHEFAGGGPACAFVSNVDGCHLADVLAAADPRTTLFIVASKTFTTLETLTNARTARAWLKAELGEQAVRDHFAAVSVNHEAMNEFGVHPDYRFQMWDWVGGRYSMWSSIGVSLAIAIGRDNFLAFLRGGHEMDEHFRAAPWRQNLPALMGMLGVWNINFRHLPTLAILPYDDRLRRFPAYLQQLEMESNGKSVTSEGTPVAWGTAAVIWGEPGNNAQHSFFQLLHQGTPRAALDFLLPARSSCGNQAQQDLAIANCLAQAEAFMAGQTAAAVRADLERQKLPAERVQFLVPHKIHVGDRPGTIVAFQQLDPATLGRLVALYEHKVFTQSVIWGINAFDQWGVELGKKLAVELAPAVRDPAGGHAASGDVTRLLQQLDRWRRNS